mmetsp:Transcript_11909/g.18046  ORF Transcript_11909/g.18046 Transcript_11909/m.18046 type:complete len:89 (+) Transcript_11909:81-347(+)
MTKVECTIFLRVDMTYKGTDQFIHPTQTFLQFPRVPAYDDERKVDCCNARNPLPFAFTTSGEWMVFPNRTFIQITKADNVYTTSSFIF